MSDTPSDAPAPDDNDSPRSASLAVYVIPGLSLYIGVFGILFLDSFVWKTHVADRWIPELFHVPMRIFFFPLLLICHWLGWLPGGMPTIR